jgi:hypothetical protein
VSDQIPSLRLEDLEQVYDHDSPDEKSELEELKAA